MGFDELQFNILLTYFFSVFLVNYAVTLLVLAMQFCRCHISNNNGNICPKELAIVDMNSN